MSFEEVIENGCSVVSTGDLCLTDIKVFHSDTDVGSYWLAQLDKGSVELVVSLETSIGQIFLLVKEIQPKAHNIQIWSKIVIEIVELVAACGK